MTFLELTGIQKQFAGTTAVEEPLGLTRRGGRGGRYPSQLPGGQQQRVALARARAIEPQVLLRDEPLSALDAKIRVALRKEIRSIQRQLGITTVYVTHDQEEALSLSDRVVVMSEGRIEQIGTPSEIYNFPATPFVASFVGTLNLFQAKVIDPAGGGLEIEGQKVRADRAVPAPAGSMVSVALRPESISLGDGSAGANHLKGPLQDVSFLGSIVRMRVGLGSESTSLSLDRFNDPHLTLPPVGEHVTVTFAPEACLVLAQNTTPEPAARTPEPSARPA